MGATSSKYSDVIILTAEDPRKESIEQINSEIEQGIKSSKTTVIKIPDRAEAITAAVQMASKGDMVILTGKAHEESMNLGHGEVDWNEFEAARLALAKNT
jgi:UDP-N-acetylmuramoyl-L-alanyl-D-glutamate--2,6-diaminopimelate ligase